MAYNFQDDLDERLKEAANQSASGIIAPGQVAPDPQGQQSNLPNVPQLNTGSGLISGTTISSDAARGAAQGPGGNRFANIGQYIQQNDPSRLSEAAGGKIEGAGEMARQGIGQTFDKFSQQVRSQTVNFDDRLADLIRQNPTQLTEAERQTVKAQRDAQFKGPRDLSEIEDYNAAKAQAEKAIALAQAAQTEEGRAQLAREVTTGRRATGGVVNLNNLLLSVDPRAQQRLGQAIESVSDIGGRLEQSRLAAQDMARTAAETTEQARQRTRELLESERAGLQQGLQQRAEARKQQLIGTDDELRQLITQLSTMPVQPGSGVHTKITPSIDYAKAPDLLGTNYDQFLTLMDTVNEAKGLGITRDLSPFVQALYSPDVVTPQAVATAEDLARYQALADLAGIAPQFLAQVGGAPNRLSSFDYNAALNDLRSAINNEKARRAAAAAPQGGGERSRSDLEKAAEAAGQIFTAPLNLAGSLLGISDKDAKKDVEKFNSREIFSSILK